MMSSSSPFPFASHSSTMEEEEEEEEEGRDAEEEEAGQGATTTTAAVVARYAARCIAMVEDDDFVPPLVAVVVAFPFVVAFVVAFVPFVVRSSSLDVDVDSPPSRGAHDDPRPCGRDNCECDRTSTAFLFFPPSSLDMNDECRPSNRSGCAAGKEGQGHDSRAQHGRWFSSLSKKY
jgi:hypothetical protein